MKLLLALLLSQAVAVSPPPSALTIPRGALYVTATTQPPDVLIPSPPGWRHPSPPSHMPNAPWFDGHPRAVLIVCRPNGYSIIVMRRNGQHDTQDFSDQSATIETSVK